MVIRDFAEDDWPAVREIIREVLVEGETYCAPADWPDDELRAFWLSDPHTLVAVSDGDGRVLGTAHCGPNRPAQGSHVGTASFMVSSAARGLGVGRLLGAAVVERLTADGFASIQFNAVVESNTAAVSLWQSLGFSVIGTVPGAFRRPSGEFVGLHVMHRPLP